jgi:hypothetical protein
MEISPSFSNNLQRLLCSHSANASASAVRCAARAHASRPHNSTHRPWQTRRRVPRTARTLSVRHAYATFALCTCWSRPISRHAAPRRARNVAQRRALPPQRAPPCSLGFTALKHAGSAADAHAAAQGVPPSLAALNTMPASASAVRAGPAARVPNPAHATLYLGAHCFRWWALLPRGLNGGRASMLALTRRLRRPHRLAAAPWRSSALRLRT